MIRWFKIFGSMLLFLVAVVLVGGFFAHESRPEGDRPELAEAYTDSMLNALNAEAYAEIKILRWSFPRGHDFVWNRENGAVNVRWDDYEVNLNTETREGLATRSGEPLWAEEKEEALTMAWRYFANDSFWLIAPYKIRDPGTTRTFIETNEGPGILVTYSSGGVTPGDTYLWILDDNHLPKKWKLWVQIIPVGGLAFTWEGWQSYQGAMIASDHIGPFGVNIAMTGISAE
jgi:hypothetical protein